MSKTVTWEQVAEHTTEEKKVRSKARWSALCGSRWAQAPRLHRMCGPGLAGDRG